MMRAQAAVPILLTLAILLLSGEDPAFSGAVPWVVAAVMLRIEFVGLVDLVSDRSSQPGKVHLLMPNATDPTADWIPEVLRFEPKHFPRLLIRRGMVDPSSTVVAPPSPHPADDGLPRVELNQRHVSIAGPLAPPAIEVDRGPAANPNEGNLSTVNYVADMDELALLAIPPLGGVSPELLQETYTGDPARISARLALDGGRLLSGDLWREPGSPYFEIDFPQKPGATVPVYRQYLARSLLFTADFEDTVSLTLRHLDQAEGGEDLILAPAGGLVDLVVSNTEHDFDEGEPHFIAHYLLRDGYAAVQAVRLPDPSWGVGGAADNAQCSPGDNGGG